MGLYQLIMSVYTMFSTFATAGFTVSVSRLVAEKDVRSHSDARLLLKTSFIASVALSAFFTLAMIFGSNYIARAFLADERCGLPLRILALSMPFMASASGQRCFYFIRPNLLSSHTKFCSIFSLTTKAKSYRQAY